MQSMQFSRKRFTAFSKVEQDERPRVNIRMINVLWKVKRLTMQQKGLIVIVLNRTEHYRIVISNSSSHATCQDYNEFHFA